MNELYPNRSSALAAVIALALYGMAFATPDARAQDQPDEGPVQQRSATPNATPIVGAEDEEDDSEGASDRMVVTGSRLRRDEFSAPSPIQVLDVETNRQIGVTNIAEMLTRSTVSSGTQIDGTLNTNAGNSNATEAPPAGGTGSSNVNLRNLDPSRTLILLNGRRLGSAGVRGAPSQPDINLIPFTLVDSVEVLTEAGSSIYGADAVAGVVNVKLRQDYEGFEIVANGDVPEADGGREYQVGFRAGANWDRARIQFGAEFQDRQRVTTGDRSFSSQLRDIEIDQNGNRFIAPVSGFFDNNGFTTPGFEVFCYRPGQGAPGSIGGENFTSCAELTPPPGFEDQGDSNFIFFPEFNDQTERANADLIQPLERWSLLTTGEVDLGGTSNAQMYFEAFYSNRQQDVIGATEQIFPTVPGQIRQVDENGNLVFERDEAGNLVVGDDGNPVPALVDNPLSPFDNDFIPILTLDDVPQTFDVEVQQVRVVTGLRGDVPFGWFRDNRWTWDTYFSYDRGTGFVSQPILFEPHLQAALNIVRNPDGSVSCASSNVADLFGFLTPEGCVPLDLLNPSAFTGGPNGEGVFSTQAERDFLLGKRTNRTAIEQYIASAFVQGDVFEIPFGGTVTAGAGFEFREDRINSDNGIVGVLGLNAAENPVQEGETKGNRNFREFFGEVNVPLITDRPGIDLLNLDGAVRFTDESNFGSEVTFRTRLQYKPVNWASISGGYGTSFRAPNLREQFLAAQGGGVSGSLDPCIQTTIATLVDQNGDDDPDVQLLINNCIASGVDFTDADGNGLPDTTGLGSQGITTIPTESGGNPDLDAETSRTYTVTGQFSQPWTDAFDFSMALSYYDIEIEDSVEEPSAGLIVSRCFQDPDFPDLSSPFCDLVSRQQTGSPESRLLNSINTTFFNIGEITARGFDLNTRFITTLPWELGDSPIDWTWTTATAYTIEQEQQTFSAADRDDNAGEIGVPEWRLNIGSQFSWGNFALLTEHRFIGDQQQDDPEPFRDNPLFAGEQLTRDVDFTDSLWYHDVALSWSGGRYSISAGVNNLLDEKPPLIDDSEGPNRNNAVSSTGFDFFGRTFFVTGRLSL